MNIFRPQKPYVFRPPKYSPLLAPLLKKIGEIFFIRRKFRVRDIAVDGITRVAELAREGNALLIGPNHADHADPHVLMAVGTRSNLAFHFMAAREGFEEKRLNAFVLQRCGAFSVDREGADISAFKTAVQILRDRKFPLVVFPEGEIYHHHEQLDPLNEGVATMILRSMGKLPEGKRAYLVPAAIRYRYDDSVESTFAPRLAALEQRLMWKPRAGIDAVERIYRLGVGLLAIKEVEFLGETQSGELPERIAQLRDRLVEMIEHKHLGQAADGSVPGRVRSLRGRIRVRLVDEDDPPSVEEKDGLYDDLDTLFAAVQLYSYPGQYLRDEPSIDRIAETILKLEEDVLGDAKYVAWRDARVHFGEPIDVAAFLEDHGLKTKSGAGPLTARLSDTIETMLRDLG